MFYYISGKLAHKTESFAVIDANGVGYKIYSTMPSLSALGEIGSDALMYTYLRTGEDIFDLYGFASQEELNMFQMLLGVSGVGARVAVGVLSTISPSKFAMAVVTNDVVTIKQAPGVGPKLAQLIILALKDKFKGLSITDMTGEEYINADIESSSEAISALMVLGYSALEAKRAISGLNSDLGLEETIKQALKRLV